MAVRQRYLGAPEPEGLDRVGRWSGAIKADRLARLAADEIVDRLLPNLAEQVPEREVDGADRHDRQTLAAIGQRGAEQLVPDLVDVPAVFADEKPAEVIGDQPRGRRPAAAGSDAHSARLGFDLDDDRAEHIDAPAGPAVAISGISRHRVGDERVNQPMAGLLLEVVAPTIGADGEDAQVGDLEF